LRKEHSHCIGDERILGDSHFVERAIAQDSLNIDAATQRSRDGWNVDTLIRRVCSYCEIEEEQLRQKARANHLARAKALVCLWGTQELKLSMREIAQKLSISQPAVSQWVNRGREYCAKEALNFTDLDS